ncbi:phosphatidylinositol-glycan biosynthesis class X protein isoform X2 [Pseudopipra pipra]|uniref:phosphatidylinositol-glycan biosynthesis class X protein isoform X2 n=1 Tax=Pseudopipra pipra TaxID=415032 RepID=UPI003138E412
MAGGRRVGAGLGALLCALHVQAACRDTTVTQELLKEGFHRDLLVKVELGEDAGGCAVAARTRLPPGIYVDSYELAMLQQQNLTKAVLIPDVTDVEAPEYLATALVLVLYLEADPRCSRCFRAAVPVHARYHRPAEGSQQASVVLESPEVLLCCCHGTGGIDAGGSRGAQGTQLPGVCPDPAHHPALCQPHPRCHLQAWTLLPVTCSEGGNVE